MIIKSLQAFLNGNGKLMLEILGDFPDLKEDAELLSAATSLPVP